MTDNFLMIGVLHAIIEKTKVRFEDVQRHAEDAWEDYVHKIFEGEIDG